MHQHDKFSKGKFMTPVICGVPYHDRRMASNVFCFLMILSQPSSWCWPCRNMTPPHNCSPGRFKQINQRKVFWLQGKSSICSYEEVVVCCQTADDIAEQRVEAGESFSCLQHCEILKQ